MRIVLSIVSHDQTALVDRLLQDLASKADQFETLILTLNTTHEPVPPSWESLAIPSKRLIRNHSPLGFGQNHNQAVNSLVEPFDYVLILNPDLVLAEEFSIARLCQRAKQQGADYFAPQVIENGQIAASARRLYTPIEALRGFVLKRRDLHKQSPAWLAGMFLGLSARAWQTSKGFDPAYFMYCEDVDLGLRLKLSGIQPHYLEEFTVTHQAQRASHRSAKRLAQHLLSACRLWTSPVFWRYWFKY